MKTHIYWQLSQTVSALTLLVPFSILFVLYPEKPLHTLQFLSRKIWLALKQAEKPYIVRNVNEEPASTVSQGKFNFNLWSLMLKLTAQVGQISIMWLFRTTW